MRSAVPRALGSATLVFLLTLGASAHAAAQEPEPFSAIAASPVTVTPDPSGRSAVLEVTTTVDAACSVVFGTDESFGRIAVDSDMDGGAHADHHPVLGGLEPATTYLYRLQGTAIDGTLYVSEVMTFTTPEAPAGPENLALGATVSAVSSEYSDAFAAGNAFDGDPSTEWSSRGDGDDAWVEIDLGQPQSIGGVVFRTRSMSDGTATAFTYGITVDGTLLGTFVAEEPAMLELTGQVLRFDVDSSTGGNTGAVEILVLADE